MLEITQEIAEKYPSLINLSQEQCDGVEFIVKKLLSEDKIEKEKVNKVIDAYQTYVDLLAKEIKDSAGFLHAHNFKSSNYEAGVRLRSELKEALDNLWK